MSTLRVTNISNAGGTKTVPADTVVDGTAKAWVNFNGTGTVAIRASFNVSSITDGGTGVYTVNFTSAMTDANYGCTGTTSADTRVVSVSTLTTSGAGIRTTNSSASLEDQTTINVAIFR